jgi:hypothetical protein
VAIGLALTCSIGRTACAQLPSDAVYEDIKTAVQDLLAKEIAENVTPRSACLLGHAPASSTTPNAIDIFRDVTQEQPNRAISTYPSKR